MSKKLKKNSIFNLLQQYLFLLLILNVYESIAQSVYVSPNGNDSNSGSISAPIKTLKKALEKAANDISIIEINIREGIYSTSETITLNSNHSRTLEAPLTIKAYLDEKVTFTCGTPISSSSFKKIETQSDLQRLPENARDKVYVANLSGKGFFQNLAEGAYGLVTWNGYLLPVAQWPNKGFGYMETVLERGPWTRLLEPGESPPEYSFEGPSGGKFIMENACNINFELLNEDLNNSQDIAVEGYFHNDWFYDRNFLARANSETKVMQLLRHTRYGIVDEKGFPRRFKLLHAISQLDMPGEWYYDKKTDNFYIWPVKEINEGSSPIQQVNNIDLIKGFNLKHIRIQNINFSGFGASGITINDSDYITIEGCSFSSSQSGRGINLRRNMNSTINACDFFDIYAAFAFDGRKENIRPLTQEHNVATNNHIYNCTLRGYGLAGIGGVGGYFSNNLIHDVNGGLIFGGNDHIIEYNEIYNAGFGMGDWNAIYLGGNLSYFGNKIQYNFFHHFPETPGAYPITGVRGDDGCSGLTMSHNIFYKTGRAGTSGSGPDVHMDGNVGISINDVWSTFQSPYTLISRQEDLDNKVAEHLQMQQDIADGKLSPNEKLNYLGRAELVFGSEGWINNQVWIDKYPNFSKIFDLTDPHSHPWTQSYSTFLNNYSSGGSYPYFYSHGWRSINNIADFINSLPNTAEAEAPAILNLDIAFENPSILNFEFKSSFTPMEGFEKWDFPKVGLYTNAYRKTIPNKEEYRKNVKAKYQGKASTGGSLDLTEINLRYPDPAYFELINESVNVEDYNQVCNILSNKTTKEIKAIAYPNPTNNIFEIQLTNSIENEVQIELFSTQAVLVSSTIYEVKNGKVILNMESLPSGIYIANMLFESPITLKIAKK